MNRIEWKVGERYVVSGTMTEEYGVLEGFILNQSTINWEERRSWRNHPTNTVWFVHSLSNPEGRYRYALAVPSLRSYIPDVKIGEPECYSEICLYGQEYADCVDDLILKLKENWVFTKELSHDAKYKEGFRQE